MSFDETDAEACAEACVADGRCEAWTYRAAAAAGGGASGGGSSHGFVGSGMGSGVIDPPILEEPIGEIPLDPVVPLPTGETAGGQCLLRDAAPGRSAQSGPVSGVKLH